MANSGPPWGLGLTNTQCFEEVQGHSPGSRELCPQQPKPAALAGWSLGKGRVAPRPTGVPPRPPSVPLCPLWDRAGSHTPVPRAGGICITATGYGVGICCVQLGKGGEEVKLRGAALGQEEMGTGGPRRWGTPRAHGAIAQIRIQVLAVCQTPVAGPGPCHQSSLPGPLG